jgi:hypothetical protein
LFFDEGQWSAPIRLRNAAALFGVAIVRLAARRIRAISSRIWALDGSVREFTGRKFGVGRISFNYALETVGAREKSAAASPPFLLFFAV